MDLSKSSFFFGVCSKGQAVMPHDIMVALNLFVLVLYYEFVCQFDSDQKTISITLESGVAHVTLESVLLMLHCRVCCSCYIGECVAHH